MSAPPVPVRRPGIPLGRVLGVPVLLTPSWFLFAGFIVVSYGQLLAERFGTGPGYAAALSYAVLLLVSVLLHELGHCAVALAFGLPVRSITVTLLAGLTEITEPPQTPAREYAVAVSGPMVSLLLAGLLAAGAVALPSGSLVAFVVGGGAVINGAVALFNLLPGLPLDGGRVLRAVVWRVSGDGLRATRVSAWSGRVVAVLTLPVTLGLLAALDLGPPSVFTLVIAGAVSAFLFAGASAALLGARRQAALPRVSIASLTRPALGVPSDLPLAEAVRRANEVGARGLVVLDAAGVPEAVVSEAAVVATPQARRPWVTVGTLARRLEPASVLEADLVGEQLLAAMRAQPASEYVVRGPHGVWGVLVAEDVARVLTA